MMGFQRLLKEKDCCYGMFVNIPDPAVVEIAKLAGIDFIRLDLEHKLMGYAEVREMVRTATLVDLAVQVRVPRLEDVTALLDFGVSNVLIPGVSTVERARKAIHESKYHPLGKRGISGDSRAIRYGHDPLKPYLFAANNENVTLGVQIEDMQAVENIDGILGLDGIDIVVTGRNDLSQSYGLLGENLNEEIVAIENRIIQKAIEAGKQPMILASGPQRAKELRDKGVRLLVVTTDNKVLYNGLKSTLEEVMG
jgi:2-keto-3-deoxy-L-rhamnonate aldolase RhmA